MPARNARSNAIIHSRGRQAVDSMVLCAVNLETVKHLGRGKTAFGERLEIGRLWGSGA
jgi:hypothetical protein